jgi:hypothetical protein
MKGKEKGIEEIKQTARGRKFRVDDTLFFSSEADQ